MAVVTSDADPSHWQMHVQDPLNAKLIILSHVSSFVLSRLKPLRPRSSIFAPTNAPKLPSPIHQTTKQPLPPSSHLPQTVTQPTLLLLGAGPTTGLSTHKHFSSAGYKTITVSLNPSIEVYGAANLTLQCDFRDPRSMGSVFEETRSKVGIPNVVIYNACAAAPKKEEDSFAVSLEECTEAMNVNLVSAYVAVREAGQCFRELVGRDVLKTFIYAGHAGPRVTTVPALMALGVEKAGAACVIEAASLASKDECFRFYFIDERTEDAGPAFTDRNGDALAEEFYKIAISVKQDTLGV